MIEQIRIRRRWLSVAHSAIALLLLIVGLVSLHFVGSQLFAGVGEGLQHLIHMIVFSFVALFVLGVNAYILLFTPMQAIILPYSDFLVQHEKRWWLFFDDPNENAKPTADECHTALGFSINSGLRFLGFIIAQALVATPL